MINVSASDIRTFVSCRQKWDFTSPLRMNLTRIETSEHLQWGIDFHEWLAAYYGRYELPKLNGFMPQIANAYKRYAAINDDFDVLETESKNVLNLGRWGLYDVNFTFTLDALVSCKSNYEDILWILEHKTTKSIPKSSGLLLIDYQALLYQFATNHIYGRRNGEPYPIGGTIYNYIKRKEPIRPNVLASGNVSRRKDLVTTADVYTKAVLDNGGDVENYVNEIAHYAAKELTDYFTRYRILFQQRSVNMWSNAIEVIKEMVRPNVVIYSSVTIGCKSCDFYDLCQVKLGGADVKKMLELGYREAQNRYDMEGIVWS